MTSTIRRNAGRTLNGLVVAVLMSGAALPALAQPVPAPTTKQAAKPKASSAVEEVVVTARKIEERLQDAPLSVTAFTATTIQNQGIASIVDLAKFTPGFSYEKAFGRRDNAQNFTFRGLSNISNAALTFPSVANFIDGVYVPGSLDGYDLSDAERIEVIRGPQSAIYGRATEAGAINYVTKKPGNDFTARVSGSYASYNDEKIFVTASGALVPDKLFVSGAFRAYSKDGQYPNLVDGKRIGAESSQSYSGQLRYTPNEAFSANLRVYYGRDRDEQPALAFSPGSADNCFLSTYPFYCGNLKNPGYVNLNRSNLVFDGLKRQSFFSSLVLSYTFANGITLSSTTGLNDARSIVGADTSYNNFLNGLGGFNVVTKGRDASLSEEVRLASSRADALHWQVGYYHYSQDSITYNLPLPATNQNIQYPTVRSDSGFIQVGYDILQNLEASAEARYGRDAIGLNAPLLTAPYKLQRSFQALTPRFILNWKVMDDKLLYVSASRGTKPGGFNAVGSAPVGAEAFQEEKVWAYEFGAKAGWLDNRLITNVALYYNDLRNQQLTLNYPLPTGASTSYNTNAGRSYTQGIELELRGKPMDNLTLSGSVSLNEGKFDDYVGVQDLCLLKGQSTILVQGTRRTLVPLASCLTGPGGNGAGQDVPKAPKVLASLVADWTAPLAGTYSYFIRPNVTYRSSSYLQVDNLTKLPSATTVNLRIGVENDKYQFTVFGNNINNNKSPVYGLRYLDFAKLVAGTSQIPFVGTSQRAFPMALPDKPQAGISATLRY